MHGRNKFIIGAITGASALIASMPFIVQMSSAATSSTVASTQAADTDKEVPDAQEAAANVALAKISATVAAQTALQAQPGQINGNTLDNEHGNLAYKIEITNAGKEYDVLVDAVSGKVIKNWEDGKDGPQGGHDANEANGQPEVKDVNDPSDATETNDPAGQNDQNEQDGSGAVEGGAASQD